MTFCTFPFLSHNFLLFLRIMTLSHHFDFLISYLWVCLSPFSIVYVIVMSFHVIFVRMRQERWRSDSRQRPTAHCRTGLDARWAPRRTIRWWNLFCSTRERPVQTASPADLQESRSQPWKAPAVIEETPSVWVSCGFESVVSWHCRVTVYFWQLVAVLIHTVIAAIVQHTV